MSMVTQSRNTSRETHYVFDNAGAQTARRWTALERLFDAQTIQHLAARGVSVGWRCLEVGGGSGSIAQWLKQQVAPGGHVLVTDIDTRFLESLSDPILEVQQHDIGSEPLPEAAFDLAHARLVLSHLPSRERALCTIISALKPGGWIVIEDFDWSSRALDPTDITAAAEFNKVQHAIWQFMTERGVDGTYGRQLWRRLRSHGLVEVDAVGRVSMYQGGSPGAELSLAAVEQLRTALVQSGVVTEEEIEAYRALLGNADFAVQSQVMMTAWGRRPPA
jgi:ubiquinone/menaquinone biosynthesis C-methylase UbiE